MNDGAHTNVRDAAFEGCVEKRAILANCRGTVISTAADGLEWGALGRVAELPPHADDVPVPCESVEK